VRCGRRVVARPSGDNKARRTNRCQESGKRLGRLDNQVLGGIAPRHELYESGMKLGRIGYGIRSTARQHGLATWALGRILDEARGLGLTRVLTICEAGDLAAAPGT